MVTLPNEILENILCRLPQRFIAIIGATVCKSWNEIIQQPSFYSTIDIYSSAQFQKLVQKASEKKHDNDNMKLTIGPYIKHLIVHTSIILKNEKVQYLKAFPNLETISGDLWFDDATYSDSKPVYFLLKQPTRFSYWGLNEKWIPLFNDIKDNLESLDIYITHDLLSNLSQKQPIHAIKLTDNNTNNNYFNSNHNNNLNLLMRRNTTTRDINNNNNFLNDYDDNTYDSRFRTTNFAYGCNTERRRDEEGRSYAICDCCENSGIGGQYNNNSPHRSIFLPETIEYGSDYPPSSSPYPSISNPAAPFNPINNLRITSPFHVSANTRLSEGISFGMKIVLPTLSNLTKLKVAFNEQIRPFPIISFYNQYIDEITFEAIHRSCPLLESLSIEDTFISISDDFSKIKMFMFSAQRLKHLHIKGLIINSEFYTYISSKYTHLESLSLLLDFKKSLKLDNKIFNHKIDHMIHQLTSLKSISIQYYNIPKHTTNQLFIDTFTKYWPHKEFLTRLCLHPSQITNLEYPYCLNINEIQPSYIMLQLHNFLDYLTSLSLCIDDIVDLTLTQLSKKGNENTTIVSTCLKELKISQPALRGYLYLNDWLVVFPNLLTLTLKDIYKITDSYIEYTPNHKITNGYKLHELINERQSQEYIKPKRQRLKNGFNNENGHCKLKKLDVYNCGVDFENGFDVFLNKCQQLNHLKLTKIRYNISDKEVLEEGMISKRDPTMVFDLSHLYLAFLRISDLQVILNEDSEHPSKYIVNRLLVHEILPNLDRTIVKITSNDCIHTLSITCKYIEGLVFHL